MSIDIDDIEIDFDGTTVYVTSLEWSDWDDLCDLIAADLGRVVEFKVDPHALAAANNAWHKAWSESYGTYSAETAEQNKAFGAWRREHERGRAFSAWRPGHHAKLYIDEDVRKTPEYAAYTEAGRVSWDRHVATMAPVNRAWLDAIGMPALTWAHDEADVGIETLRQVVGCMPFKLDTESADWLSDIASGEFCGHFVRVVAAAWKAGVLK